jgi:hypothetical protein
VRFNDEICLFVYAQQVNPPLRVDPFAVFIRQEVSIGSDRANILSKNALEIVTFSNTLGRKRRSWHLHNRVIGYFVNCHLLSPLR